MNFLCLGGGRRALLLGVTFAGVLVSLPDRAGAQENAAKPAPPAAAPAKSAAPKPPAAAPSGKRSLAPRPRGETPPALAADPAVRANASAASAAPATGGDGTPGEEPLVLPSMSVTGEQATMPKKPEVLDEKARLELALKANPGLRLGGPLGKLNNGIALEMQREAKEAAARAALIAHVENLPAMDEERAKEEIRLMREATARPNNDWRQRR